MLPHQDAGFRVGSARRSRRDVDDDTSEPDGIVVSDGGFIGEGNAVLDFFFGDGDEGGTSIRRGEGEAGVVAGDELCRKPGIGGLDTCDVGQSEFGHEAILEGSEGSLDAPLGLGTGRGDRFDPQFLQHPSDVCGELSSLHLFLEAPVSVGAYQAGVLVMIDGHGDSVCFQDSLQQAQVSFGGFHGGEEGRQEGRGGVVHGGQEAAGKMVFPEPGVWAAIPLDHLADTLFSLAPAAVLGGTASPLGWKPCAPQDLSDRFASQIDSFPFPEEFREMGVIGVRVPLRMELDDAGPDVFAQRVDGCSPAVPMDQPLPVGMSEPCFEAFGLSVADPDQCRGHHQGHPFFRNLPKHSHPLELSTAHDDFPLHGHPLRRGDIFPWQ